MNQGFEKGVFGNREPFGVCFTYSIFYIFSVVVLIAYKRLKYGDLLVKALGIFWAVSISLVESVSYFDHDNNINIENVFYVILLLIFMFTYKNYSFELPFRKSIQK